MRGHSPSSENKYADQVNDASTVLHYRKNGGKRIVGEEILDEAVKANPDLVHHRDQMHYHQNEHEDHEHHWGTQTRPGSDYTHAAASDAHKDAAQAHYRAYMAHSRKQPDAKGRSEEAERHTDAAALASQKASPVVRRHNEDIDSLDEAKSGEPKRHGWAPGSDAAKAWETGYNSHKKLKEDYEDLDEGYKIGDKVNATNHKATPGYTILAKNKTHYHLSKHNDPSTSHGWIPKERIARVNKAAHAHRQGKPTVDPRNMPHNVKRDKTHNGNNDGNIIRKEEIEKKNLGEALDFHAHMAKSHKTISDSHFEHGDKHYKKAGKALENNALDHHKNHNDAALHNYKAGQAHLDAHKIYKSGNIDHAASKNANQLSHTAYAKERHANGMKE